MVCTTRPARRFLALSLCLTLFLASPGLLPYAALAGGLSSARGGQSARPTARYRAQVPPTGAVRARPVPGLPMSLRSLGLRASASTWASPAPHAGAQATPAPSLLPAAPEPFNPGPLAAAASRASGLSAGVSGILEAAGELSQAQPGLARRTGQNIQDLLSGAKDQESFGSMSNPFPRSAGFSQAKPAGDSIRESQQLYYQGQNPEPPQPPPGPPPSAGESSGSPEGRSPLWAKLVFAGLGLLPAYFLGLPILLEVSPWLSFLYLAAVVAVASLPITPSGTWNWLRRIPGVLLGWAGAVALLAGSSLGMGLAAGLGGIALYHLSGKLSDPKLGSRVADEPTYLGGYLGALGLVAGLGLALLGLPHWPGYILSPLLLRHLPLSLRIGLWTALKSPWQSMKAAHRGLAFWHDTRFDRNLSDFLDYHSPWLAPLWAVTRIMKLLELLLAGALGLLLLATPGRFVSLFLAGATRAENPDGFFARFWDGFNRSWFETIEGSRDWLLKPAVQWLIPAMGQSAGESRRPTLKAILAFALARIVSVLWLAAVLLLATVLTPSVLLANLLAGYKAVMLKPQPGSSSP